MPTFHRLAAQAAICLTLSAPFFHAFAQTSIQPGPGTWSANQVWANDTTYGGALSGYFYWPATAPVLGNQRALVLVLHGCGQTAGGDVINGSGDGGYNWKAVADQYGAVILAPNATGNVYGTHCWDWAAANRSRSYGHNAVLIELVNRFLNDPQYAIDRKQVYVAGLSSGGAKAMVLGCTAPDIFAGLGLSAAPPPGVSTGQISLVPADYNSTTAANACSAMAGSMSADFATQVTGVIWGSSDYTVAQGYGPLDAAAMRQVYGGAYTQGAAVTVAGGGSDVQYKDANGKVRTSQITVAGLGHAWPAGAGGQNANFVNATKVNYPAFIMDFWFNKNLRVSPLPAPTMTACSASVSGSTVTVNGAASVTEGSVTGYRVVLSGPTPVNDNAAGSGASFSKAYAGQADGSYSGSVRAVGSNGQVSGACSIPAFQVDTGTPPVFTCTTSTASNYAHVQAGRAHVGSGYALANGSNQNMGLYNVYFTSMLAQTAERYYIVGNCP